MSRRNGRARRIPSATTRSAALLLQALSVFANGGGRFFLAHRYSTDVGTGKTASFDCMISGKKFAQATSAQQPALPSSDAAVQGRLGATFAGSQWLDSDDAASYWKPLHDGSGSTWYELFKPTAVSVLLLHSTRVFAATTEIGHASYINNAVNFFSLESNGTVEALSLSGGSPVVGTPTYLSQKFATASTPDGDLRQKSTSVSSGNAGALSSANPDGSLRLGAGIAPNNRLPLQAVWYGFFYVPRVISAAEDAVIQNFIRTWFGIQP